MTKKVFFDAEFTGEHQFSSLVSIGMVGENTESCYICFNGYEKNQVTVWLKENVLKDITHEKKFSYQEGFNLIKKWLENYSNGELVSLVSMGKTLDLVLFFQLWHLDYPEKKYFHNLYCLPHYLNHSKHYDLATLMMATNIDPDIDRETIVTIKEKHNRHNALYDAKIVKKVYEKCIKKLSLSNKNEF